MTSAVEWIARAAKLGWDAYDRQEPLLAKAFDAVDFPKFGDDSFAPVVYADPSALTKEQRRLCESFIDVEFHSAAIGGYAVPDSVATRRRWLGADPAGRLEQCITFVWHGQKMSTPIWRALQLTRSENKTGKVAEVVAKLPIAERLEVLAELSFDELYDIDAEAIIAWDSVPLTRDVAKLRDRGAAWARAALSRAAAFETFRMHDEFCKLMFDVLLAAKQAIAPQWEKLIPYMPLAAMKPILRALPRGRHDVALPLIAAKAPDGLAFLLALVRQFPSRTIFEMILGLAEERGVSLRKIAPTLEAAARRDATLLALVKRGKKTTTPLVALIAKQTLAPKSPSDLTPLQRRQLEDAFTRCDDKHVDTKLTAKVLLGPGEWETTGSVRGMLRITEVSREGGKRAYTVFEYLGDSGMIYEAGTTKVVASIAQGGIECDDVVIAESLAMALAARKKKTR